MRISDWSSDVCSSDLGAVDCLEKPFADGLLLKVLANAWPMLERNIEIQRRRETAAAYFGSLTKRELDVVRALSASGSNRDVADELRISVRTVEMHRASIMKRWEEHTSELQSLMRHSYAVFCL